MTPAHLQELASLAGAGLDAASGSVRIDGNDPAMPAKVPMAEVAAVALAEIGDAARELSRQAGGDPGMVQT